MQKTPINAKKAMCDRPIVHPTDRAGYRVACTGLKTLCACNAVQFTEIELKEEDAAQRATQIARKEQVEGAVQWFDHLAIG